VPYEYTLASMLTFWPCTWENSSPVDSFHAVPCHATRVAALPLRLLQMPGRLLPDCWEGHQNPSLTEEATSAHRSRSLRRIRLLVWLLLFFPLAVELGLL
jgi:hypothetical protein